MRRPSWAWILILAAGCSVPVQHGLDEPSANEVTSALERAGIGAEKMRDEGPNAAGFTVSVSRGDAAHAMDLMRSLGLPRGHRSGFAEVYGQPSLIPSASEERARYLEALSGELERTLESVDGVIGARVHLVPTETDPLALDGKPRISAQAAVLLKTRSGAPPIKETDVQKLVAGSVPGLQTSAVAVVVTAAPEWSGSTTAPTLTALGPLRLSPGSKTVLLAGLAAGLGLIAVLAALLLITARRLSALQRNVGLRPE